MSTLRLDSTGDLAIENNSFVLVDDLAEEVSQRLKAKFRFFLGEWHLDARQGFPLLEQVFVKNPSISHLRVLFRETIERDEGVSTLDDLIFDFNTAARLLTASFTASLIDGTVLDVADFILEENR
jgi:hypothetical protein